MIASFEHNFIFIKTRKTGGTTVEIALTPSCGPRDILTPITMEDELLRLQDGKVAARNYVDDPALEAEIAAAVLQQDAARVRKLKRRSGRQGGLHNHSPAAKIRSKLPKDFWDKAFKFTVERHPYEKVVSGVYWGSRNDSPDDFSKLIDEKVAKRPEDLKLYSIGDDVVVDEILRQETLEADLARLAEKFGLELPPRLPKAKGAFRTDRRPAHEILSPAQKAVIYERHRKTFDLLGYEP
ncbi:hypothetical protein [Bauldia litoralis]|uniref:hypothetical protein n=1 Tax=Bauldia litoralis TaxID=665467 RepID=UPI0032657E29